MDVAALVTRARQGDVDAFTELVRRYQAMAFGSAYAQLGDFHLAEDAAQQAFITAYRNLAKLQHAERFGGWLRGGSCGSSARTCDGHGASPRSRSKLP